MNAVRSQEQIDAELERKIERAYRFMTEAGDSGDTELAYVCQERMVCLIALRSLEQTKRMAEERGLPG